MNILQLRTRLFLKGLVSNRPKQTRVIFNSNDLFLMVHLIFLTLCRFVLLTINSDEIIVNSMISILLINYYQNAIDILVESIM